jgi:hypothetical protein
VRGRGPLDGGQRIEWLQVLGVDLLLALPHVADPRHGQGVGAEDDDGEQADDRADLGADGPVGEPPPGPGRARWDGHLVLLVIDVEGVRGIPGPRVMSDPEWLSVVPVHRMP